VRDGRCPYSQEDPTENFRFVECDGRRGVWSAGYTSDDTTVIEHYNGNGVLTFGFLIVVNNAHNLPRQAAVFIDSAGNLLTSGRGDPRGDRFARRSKSTGTTSRFGTAPILISASDLLAKPGDARRPAPPNH
jgi:hypothetical protein